MDLLFRHTQEKKDRTKTISTSYCDLRLYVDGLNLLFQSIYEFDYDRYGTKKHISFEHIMVINTVNGDINTSYKIINEGLTDDKIFRNITKNGKNDFNMIFNLIENGILRGEKRKAYWGVKFERALIKLEDFFIILLQPKFKSSFFQTKNYKFKPTLNTIYDLIVDYHLDVKGIKGHDGIYYDIQHEYPKKKWLEKNEYKYLPAVLDSYGIKSRYLISELSKNWGRPIQISAVNYLCKLFGSEYINYIKDFKWETHCYDTPPNKKTHELKNESEKQCMVKMINKWETDTLKTDSLVYSLNKLFTIRDLLEKRGLNLKFKAKNDNDFDNTMEVWSGYKLHFVRGYKVKYLIPEDVVKEIENDICVGDKTFKPKVLLTEDEFRLEGYSMKNCMSKQFPHGILYIFISLHFNRKKINLQYRKGNLVQSYGKANTTVDSVYDDAVTILSNRLKKFSNLEWKKEKYEFISN
jgi:hypothetical protein